MLCVEAASASLCLSVLCPAQTCSTRGYVFVTAQEYSAASGAKLHHSIPAETNASQLRNRRSIIGLAPLLAAGLLSSARVLLCSSIQLLGTAAEQRGTGDLQARSRRDSSRPRLKGLNVKAGMTSSSDVRPARDGTSGSRATGSAGFLAPGRSSNAYRRFGCRVHSRGSFFAGDLSKLGIVSADGVACYSVVTGLDVLGAFLR